MYLQADWQKNYDDLSKMMFDLDMLDSHAKLADITPERLRSGLWVESDTDTLYIVAFNNGLTGERLSVYCWNHPQARVEIMNLLCKPVWRV